MTTRNTLFSPNFARARPAAAPGAAAGRARAKFTPGYPAGNRRVNPTAAREKAGHLFWFAERRFAQLATIEYLMTTERPGGFTTSSWLRKAQIQYD